MPPKSTYAVPGVAGANAVSTLPSGFRRVITMSLARAALAGHHDLAVGREGDRVRTVRPAEIDGLHAVAGEARVRRAVRVQPGDREVAAAGARRSDEHELPVRLLRAWWTRCRRHRSRRRMSRLPRPRRTCRVCHRRSAAWLRNRVALPWPETTIRSSARTTTPPPVSFTAEPVLSVVLPPDPKVASGVPSEPNLATAKSPPPVAVVDPTTTIRPSGVSAMWVPRSMPPKSSVCLPSALNVVSRSPGVAAAAIGADTASAHTAAIAARTVSRDCLAT